MLTQDAVPELNFNFTRSYFSKFCSPVWFKVNIGSTRTMSQLRRFGVIVVDFKHISRIVLVFPLLTLNK